MIQNEHQNYLDSEGYPTEETLKLIRDFDLLRNGKEELLSIIKEIWCYHSCYQRDEERLTLITGGWGGNEDIIRALEGSMFWVLYWESSHRGGKYTFYLKEAETII